MHSPRTTKGHSRASYDRFQSPRQQLDHLLDGKRALPSAGNLRAALGGTAGKMSAPATSGAKPPTLPLSKARRELAELLEHARTLEADGETTRLLSQDSPTSGEGGGPQIARWGVKINDEYCIIAARKVDEDRRLRFDLCGNQPVCRVHPTILH